MTIKKKLNPINHPTPALVVDDIGIFERKMNERPNLKTIAFFRECRKIYGKHKF